MKITGVCIQMGNDDEGIPRIVLGGDRGIITLSGINEDDLFEMPNLMYKRVSIIVEVNDG